MICPRCKRTSVVWEEWGRNDVVAVCRSVRSCGFRSHIINGLAMKDSERINAVKLKENMILRIRKEEEASD